MSVVNSDTLSAIEGRQERNCRGFIELGSTGPGPSNRAPKRWGWLRRSLESSRTQVAGAGHPWPARSHPHRPGTLNRLSGSGPEEPKRVKPRFSHDWRQGSGASCGRGMDSSGPWMARARCISPGRLDKAAGPCPSAHAVAIKPLFSCKPNAATAGNRFRPRSGPRPASATARRAGRTHRPGGRRSRC